MTDRLAAATSGKARLGGRVGGWLGGRARRREYWAWMTPIVVLEVLLSGFGAPVFLAAGLLRTLVWIRRIHDLGQSGWFVVIFNVATNVLTFASLGLLGPETGGVVSALVICVAIIVMGVIPGQTGRNQFGPAPGRKVEIGETFA